MKKRKKKEEEEEAEEEKKKKKNKKKMKKKRKKTRRSGRRIRRGRRGERRRRGKRRRERRRRGKRGRRRRRRRRGTISLRYQKFYSNETPLSEQQTTQCSLSASVRHIKFSTPVLSVTLLQNNCLYCTVHCAANLMSTAVTAQTYQHSSSHRQIIITITIIMIMRAFLVAEHTVYSTTGSLQLRSTSLQSDPLLEVRRGTRNCPPPYFNITAQVLTFTSQRIAFYTKKMFRR